ncbi:hypothetical protein [Sphingomicrobium nitratireducens]|uniref:hypothetical protein n=1 Tax=Sphingomicrobium nitratireducens TaxID=2964666 RepID=UPI002240D254|nr:hypothetical protein [Sphingomicrobium nitratireducens]
MFFVFLVVLLAVGGWYALEAFKIKHGYPTSDALGNGIEPGDDARAAALEAENAALRGQLEAVHDRLETLERIVTDKPSQLEKEIDALKTLSDHRENAPEVD